MQEQVKLPYSFFVKTAQNDYRYPTEAIWREFLQNSVDAKAKNIYFKLTTRDNGVIVFECQDDGCGMTEDIIRNKLLTLGETSKEGQAGQTGGFGVAKTLIYFSHLNYTIYTLDNIVKGSGGSYSIEKSDTVIHGCHAVVELNKDVIDRSWRCHNEASLKSSLKDEIEKSYLPNTNITINDVKIDAVCKKGRKIADLGNVTIHKIPSNYETSSAFVRVNGLHMFSIWTRKDQKFRLIVELQTYSTEMLTSNRDGFRAEWDTKVMAAIDEICTNPDKSRKSSTNFYKGQASRISPFSEVSLLQLSQKINDERKNNPEISDEAIEKEIVQTVAESGFTGAEAEKQVSVIRSLVKYQCSQNQDVNLKIHEINEALAYNVYIITVGKYKKVPSAWQPEQFSDKQKNLLALWGKIVGLVMRDAGRQNEKYDVGYCFDDGSQGDPALAMYQKLTVNYEALHVIYLNPCLYGDAKSFPIGNKTKRMEMLMWLIALAIHEVNHLLGYEGHTPEFIAAEANLKFKVYSTINDYLTLD